MSILRTLAWDSPVIIIAGAVAAWGIAERFSKDDDRQNRGGPC